jgi:hypothetical protein
MENLLQRFSNCTVSVVISLLLLSCSSVPPPLRFEQQIAAFAESTKSIPKVITADALAQREARFREGYVKFIAPNLSNLQMSTLGDTTLAELFDVVDIAVFYFLEPEIVIVQKKLFDELLQRNLLKSFHAVKLFDNQIRTRQFEAASKTKVAYPQVSKEALPKFRSIFAYSETFPTAWILHSDVRVMEQVRVQLQQKWQIVVVSHPYCSFSRKAAAEIFADTTLSASLVDKMLWVAPQDANFSYDNFAKWNQQYPLAQHMVVHQQSIWPLDNFTQTPYFYFMQNGKVQAVVTGWPQEGAKAAFVGALERIKAE